MTESMRSTLVQWMHDLCQEEQKLIDVFYHSVMMFDRFMVTLQNVKSIKIDKSYLQLFATGCLFISSKVRSNTPFDAFNLVEYTDNSITLNDLLESELFILETLNWDVDSIVPNDFFDHLTTEISHKKECIRSKFYQETAKCAMEFSLQFFAPSQIASVCLLKALNEFEMNDLNDKVLESIKIDSRMEKLMKKFNLNINNDSVLSESWSSLLCIESSPLSNKKCYGRITKKSNKKLPRKDSLKMKKVLDSSICSVESDSSATSDLDCSNSFLTSSPMSCY
jgi:hypothetical protein